MADKAELTGRGASTSTATQNTNRGRKPLTQKPRANTNPINPTKDKPKSYESLDAFIKGEGRKDVWYVLANGKRNPVTFFPAKYTIKTEKGLREIIYSNGAHSIFKSELVADPTVDKVRRNVIQIRDGRMHIAEDNPLLQWYFHEVTNNGNPPFSKVAKEDKEKDAELELYNFEIKMTNYEEINAMSWARAAAICRELAKIKGSGVQHPEANAPLKALQARILKYNEVNAQSLLLIMKDENVEIKHYAASAFETGTAELNGNTILINGEFVCHKPPASSAADTLASYIIESDEAKDRWLGVLEDAVEQPA